MYLVRRPCRRRKRPGYGMRRPPSRPIPVLILKTHKPRATVLRSRPAPARKATQVAFASVAEGLWLLRNYSANHRPLERGVGKPGFPTPRPREILRGRSSQAGGWRNLVSPSPRGLRPSEVLYSHGQRRAAKPWLWGYAPVSRRTAPFFTLPGWGREPGSSLSSRPCGCAAPRRNEHKVILGRAAPSQTLPRVEEWGNPVSPFPCPSSLFSR